MKSVLKQLSLGLIQRNRATAWLSPRLRASDPVLYQATEGIVDPTYAAIGGSAVNAIYNQLRGLQMLSPSRIEVRIEPRRLVRPVEGSVTALPTELDDKILRGDAMELYAKIPSDSIHLIITSPPYWGLRKYGGGRNELGREWHPNSYVENLIAHTLEWKRILHPNGSLYLNLGDCYFANKGFNRNKGKYARKTDHHYGEHDKVRSEGHSARDKQLLMLPAKVAIRMCELGWLLRNEIPWIKPNPIPSYSPDRRLPVHEQFYFFAKTEKYYYDNELGDRIGAHRAEIRHGIERFGQHQATFPETLIAPLVLISSKPDDVVFDPFMGAGTVAVVAKRCSRHWLGFELVKENWKLANQRVEATAIELYDLDEVVRRNGIKPCQKEKV